MSDLIKPGFAVLVVSLILSLGLAAPVAAGPLEDGLGAREGGDNAAAARLMRPLAEQGVAEAQNNLGVRYENGRADQDRKAGDVNIMATPPPDWLSWGFWSRSTEGLYHAALIVGGVIGLLLLIWRTFSAGRSATAALQQARIAEQGHITERFTKAIEQLGSDKLAVRLGAIYALERISRDSPRDHWSIMETLTAYVRERAPWLPRASGTSEDGSADSAPNAATSSVPMGGGTASNAERERQKPPIDIQAILTLLGRRIYTDREREALLSHRLDLSETNLRGADLNKAQLEGAYLLKAQLQGAYLWMAQLEEAELREAQLQGAYLIGAQLQGANLSDAQLQGADLTKAELQGALGLSQKQLDKALGDEKTTLPDGLTRPAHWRSASQQS